MPSLTSPRHISTLPTPAGRNAQNCVEELCLIGVLRADSFCWVQEIRSMMGKRRLMQEALFFGFSLERHVPDTRSATPRFGRVYGLA